MIRRKCKEHFHMQGYKKRHPQRNHFTSSATQFLTLILILSIHHCSSAVNEFLSHNKRRYNLTPTLNCILQENNDQTTYYYKLLSHLRGGFSHDDDDEETQLEQDDNSYKTSFFRLVNGVFQMNIDAKDELINNAAQNRLESLQNIKKISSVGGGAGNTAIMPKPYTNNQEETDDEKEIYINEKESPFSSRLLNDDDGDIDDDYVEDVVESEIEEADYEEEDNNEEADFLEESDGEYQKDDEEEEANEEDGTNDKQNEYEDNNYNLENDDKSNDGIKEKQNEHEDNNYNLENDDDSNDVMKDPPSDSTFQPNDVHESSTIDEEEEEDSTEESSTETETDEKGLLSINEIVQEEWNMIPDTEVEDESYENISYARKQLEAQRENLKLIQKEEKRQRHLERQQRREERERKKREREERRNKKNEERNNNKKEQSDTSKDNKKEQSINTEMEEESLALPPVPLASSQKAPGDAFISSGWWSTIDRFSSFGLSTSHEELRLSKKLHSIRKKAAHITGLHGIISGKGRGKDASGSVIEQPELNEEDLGRIRRRLAAIEVARKRVESTDASINNQEALRQIPRWRRIFARRQQNAAANDQSNSVPQRAAITDNDNIAIETGRDEKEASLKIPTPTVGVAPTKEDISKRKEMVEEDLKRREARVKEIDQLINEGKRKILEFQCLKDELQRRPNPLYNYTKTSTDVDLSSDDDFGSYASARTFNFPSDDLIREYMEELQSSGRLQKMNHTYLWKMDSGNDIDDDDEAIGDDILTPSGDVRKLYENNNDNKKKPNDRRNGGNNGGGSWLLRQSLGMGGSLGEKIGVAIEEAAYKGVCSSIMSILAKSLATLHGLNVMQHSDIRLFVEKSPDLPPVSKSIYSSSSDDYAREAIGKAIRKGSKKKKKRKHKPYNYGSHTGDDAFAQRDAVVETLISHCQISAPLLKLFPAEWQRALLGNIITLIAAVISDFCEGVQFQILGHYLSFSFKPITEADMIQHIGVSGFRFNHRRARPEEFEAAVRATADDISQSLSFLDRWHQRALGGDLLRAQIGDLIARVVLTLVDEVLHSARMDLWSAQVGGPRIVAGLEYRIENI